MKLLLTILSLLLVLLLAGLWVGTGSYPDRWRTQERSTAQELANKEKKEQIDKMKAELDDAASGNAAVEERARSELGMTGKGETFYEVILQPDAPNDTLNEKHKKSIEIKDKNKKTDTKDSETKKVDE
ncbi:MAG: septum formation initiator family protein [Cocleimonas sp.]|nr:septum formation initiator family protein [Cocleimonas sp.]